MRRCALLAVVGMTMCMAAEHLPAQGAPELAEGYPLDAFVTDDGKLMPGGWVVERHPRR